MHPIGNFAADDRSPELQISNLSTISSADRIFIHHVLLKGRDRHLLGSAMVRHTVPPCSTIYTSPSFVKGSISNFRAVARSGIKRTNREISMDVKRSQLPTKVFSMNDTTLLSHLSLPEKALMFDLEALYACLQTIPDRRDRRGLQYPFASLLLIGLLAKLAGQDSCRGMAHWAKLRSRELSQLFHLKREKMPHYSTWSRVLGHGVEP